MYATLLPRSATRRPLEATLWRVELFWGAHKNDGLLVGYLYILLKKRSPRELFRRLAPYDRDVNLRHNVV